MQVSFNIDINDYMSVNDIEDMVREEVRCQISNKVDSALRYVSISDIIYSTARKTAMQLLEEQDVDIHHKIANKLAECIDDLSLYYVLRDDDNGNKSKGQLVLDECVEEAKPKIKQKVDEIIEDKLNAAWLIDEVIDSFYNGLRKQLIGG